jgi:hypothetical protein
MQYIIREYKARKGKIWQKGTAERYRENEGDKGRAKTYLIVELWRKYVQPLETCGSLQNFFS